MIEDIKVVAEVESDPDLSHLGEYRKEPGPEDRTVGIGDAYFVAAHGPEETGNPDSVMQDCYRMESYGEDWVMLGIRAVAEIRVRGTIQTIRSGGLWGVASDSGRDYLNDVARDEVGQLKEILDVLGMDTARSAVWHEDAPISGVVK